MARNLDPKHKICRTHGVKLCDSFKCPVTKRNYPPGQHGNKKFRGKLSDYGKQLREKQKAKYIYGVLEKQFRLTFNRASKLPGRVDDNLMTLLEKRLDNAVFRAGFATTKRLARQLVNHGHFELNGRRMTIPSYTVKNGDVFTVLPSKKKLKYWSDFAAVAEKKAKHEAPGWISVDKKHLRFTIVAEPNKSELPQIVESHLIVEYYSR